MPNYYYPESEQELNQHNDDERARYHADNFDEQFMCDFTNEDEETKSVEHVHIDEIYPNGKPKKNKVAK